MNKLNLAPLSRKLLLHIVIYLVLFLVIPYFQSGGTGVMEDLGSWLLLLVLVNPTAVLILAADSGLKLGFSLLVCLLPLPLFVLSTYVLFDGSGALFYGIMYSVIALISNSIAASLRRRKKGETK
ncbi:hypothetical protein MKZ24_33000 [Paenibacillus sp. FSL R7-0297]|uniref:hypothetical protein n=1 Tax=unclassified Paenibacillus TaxID=185978 RepID=UPI0030F6F985